MPIYLVSNDDRSKAYSHINACIVEAATPAAAVVAANNKVIEHIRRPNGGLPGGPFIGSQVGVRRNRRRSSTVVELATGIDPILIRGQALVNGDRAGN